MSLKDCYNFNDFRKLAKRNLPAPIFHYIDGGSDDEATLKRNTESFTKCDLVPSILTSVGEPDMTTEVFGQKIKMPKQLYEDLVTYADGTPATPEQMAKDVTTFMAWTAEPKLEERHKFGFRVIIYLVILTILVYFSMKKIWSAIETKV